MINGNSSSEFNEYFLKYIKRKFEYSKDSRYGNMIEINDASFRQ